MNVKKEVTMNWNEAPDTITPEIYAQIRGRSIQWARDKFNEKNFPRLDGKLLIADKTAVKLYDLGINPKQNQKASVDYLILLELRKLNERKWEQMKISWKNFRIDKNKVYMRLGQAVVYSSLYIAGIVFSYWMFLQGMTY